MTITATAEAILQLNRDETELTYEVRIAGIDPAQITQAHLHVGPRGFNGPVVLFLADGPPPEPVLKGTLTAADLIPNADVSVETFADFVAALKAGDVYVNVHTMTNPSGEIRGQVAAPIALVSSLNGDQEVPPVTTTASGSATFELSADRTRLRYTVDVNGIETDLITQAHLHVAPRGVNGPIVLFLVDGPPSALPLHGELTAADLIPRRRRRRARLRRFRRPTARRRRLRQRPHHGPSRRRDPRPGGGAAIVPVGARRRPGGAAGGDGGDRPRPVHAQCPGHRAALRPHADRHRDRSDPAGPPARRAARLQRPDHPVPRQRQLRHVAHGRPDRRSS